MRQTGKKSNIDWWILIIVIGIVAAIVITFGILSRGEVKTTGANPAAETTETLRCSGKNIAYEFFSKDEPASAEIKINAIFADSKISSISLVHRTTYDNEDNAKQNSNIHEGDMNKSFQSHSMDPYSLSATYSLEKNIAQMSIYTRAAELNSASIKYFMLDSLPNNISGYEKAYKAKGFNCEITK